MPEVFDGDQLDVQIVTSAGSEPIRAPRWVGPSDYPGDYPGDYPRDLPCDLPSA